MVPWGDISGVSALTSLQELWLSNMKVTSDFNCVNAFTSLLCFDRRIIQLQGDIGSMSALANLQTLALYKTQVTGDVGGRNNMANLQRLFLCLRKTKVVIPAAVLQTVPVTKNVQVVLMPTVSPAIKDMAGLAILSSALTEKEIL